MREIIFRLARDVRGNSAAEMVLSLPLLFAILFGAFELGNFFMTEHKVVKAVRDGARYAARRPYTDYPGCTASNALIDATRNVTRTGQVSSGGDPRVWGWTDPTSVTVSATCDNTGTYTGIYVTSPIGTPVVTVVAQVPYTPLLGQLGLTDAILTLNARSHAAVTGI